MMRLTHSSLTRTCRALLLGVLFLTASVSAYAQGSKADAIVKRALRDGRGLPVIVQFKNDAAFRRAKNLKSGKAEIKRTLKALRALGVKANHRALREYLASADVAHISYDAPVRSNLLDLTVAAPPAVSVDGSASKVTRSRYGVSGAGVAVAVIDSGVQPHADLPASRITQFVDFVNGRLDAYDDYGHGTHVAGIVAGTGAASAGEYTGVAPEASIVALKVLDSTGAGTTSNVLAALEWVLNNHATYGIRVVNLSLGHPIYEAAATDPLVQAVETLTARGLLVVVSAGNMGRNSLGQTVYGSITSPANAQGAIAVGAADTNLTLARGDDTVASFSSRGPTRFDNFVKPDVLAPGYQIASLLAPDSTLALKYPHLQIGASYFRLNGTSQSAPVVAGAAALLFQANPTLTSHTVKGIVQFTAQRLPNLDVMTQGAGEVNVAGAVRFAKMVRTNQTDGKRWVIGNRKPIGADLLFGETVYWGRALLMRDVVKANTNAMFVKSALWDDNIVWGMFLDDNIVWGMFLDENIVWGMTLDNLVWGMNDENLVWGLNDDNLVWGFDDSVAGQCDDNIVWGMDNLVWGGGQDSVMAFSEQVIGLSYETIDSASIMTEGGR
jgi:serine protease AprX